MGRPYAVKGRKKKRKLDDGEASHASPAADLAEELPPPEEDEKEKEEVTEEEAAEVAEGLPVVPRPVDGKRRPGAIFVLERACLEVGKVGKTMQILNSDDHANYLRKQNRNPADYRPDIIHQALLAIFDSPLTKAGRLQAVYVRTEKGVLFEIKPHVRMPRTFKRFCFTISIHTAGQRSRGRAEASTSIERYGAHGVHPNQQGGNVGGGGRRRARQELPIGGGGGGEGAHVRQGGDAERRGEAQPAGDPEAARGEVLPARRVLQREGPPAQLRGPHGEALALPLLLLEQQPELRHDQGLEPLRQGEAPRRRGHRLLRPRRRGGRAGQALHRLATPPRRRRLVRAAHAPPPAPLHPLRAVGTPHRRRQDAPASFAVHLRPPPPPTRARRRIRRVRGGQQAGAVLPAAAAAAGGGAGVGAGAHSGGARGAVDSVGVEAGAAVRGEPRVREFRGGSRRRQDVAASAVAAAVAAVIFVVVVRESEVLFES